MLNKMIFDIILFPLRILFRKKQIIPRQPPTFVDNSLYLQKVQIYSLTGNEKVFSEDYVMPEKIPVDFYETYNFTSTGSNKINFERHLRNFEFAFANQAQLQIINEYRAGLEEKFPIFMKKISTEYFDNLFHLNPHNLDLTFFLLKFRSGATKNLILSKMIFHYPLNFELDNLIDIYKKIQKKPKIFSPSALLAVYLAGHFEKYAFYAQFIDGRYVEYGSYYQLGHEHENMQDSFLANVLDAKKKYLGRSLRDVVAIEHPEILLRLSEYSRES